MKRHLLIISIAILLSILIVSGLFVYGNHSVERQNGFTRRFCNGQLLQKYTSNIDHMAVVALCGTDGLHFYFKTSDPTIVVRTNIDLSNAKAIKLQIDLPAQLIARKNFELVIHDSLLTLFLGNIPSIIRGNFQTNQYTEHKLPYKLHRAVLSDTPGVFYIRGFGSDQSKSIFRYNLSERQYSAIYTEAGQLNDGGLLNDGILNFDSTTHLLVYNHYYNNRILILDTALRLKWLAHTIDTFSQFQTSATNVKGSYTFNKPKHTLIGHASTYRGRLFVLSLLIADNEEESSFKNQSPIDIYDIKKGTYITSMYIPHFRDKRPLSFKIIDSRLIATYPDQIILYELPDQL